MEVKPTPPNCYQPQGAPSPTEIQAILKERQHEYGDFTENSRIAQKLHLP